MGVKSPIRTNDVFFGYEDGDLTKKVEIRITGVLSDVETIGDVSSVSEGEKIYVKNVGEKIKNPEFNKTYKQIFKILIFLDWKPFKDLKDLKDFKDLGFLRCLRFSNMFNVLIFNFYDTL